MQPRRDLWELLLEMVFQVTKRGWDSRADCLEELLDTREEREDAGVLVVAEEAVEDLVDGRLEEEEALEGAVRLSRREMAAGRAGSSSMLVMSSSPLSVLLVP